MSSSGDEVASRSQRKVPGVVRLMTVEPIEVPESATEQPGRLAEQFEERPWLVAAAIVVVFAGLVLASRRRH